MPCTLRRETRSGRSPRGVGWIPHPPSARMAPRSSSDPMTTRCMPCTPRREPRSGRSPRGVGWIPRPPSARMAPRSSSDPMTTRCMRCTQSSVRRASTTRCQLPSVLTAPSAPTPIRRGLQTAHRVSTDGLRSVLDRPFVSR